jgi:protein-S-isoprenylcysteine O-methyltransferase Ste14
MQWLELRLPPVALVIILAGAMWLLVAVSPALAIALPAAVAVATVCALTGTAVALAGVYAFKKARTTVDPRSPDKAEALVIAGIYRLSRNPMYLGFLLILLGWACYLQHMLPFLLLPLFVLYINRFQIRPEERFMQQKFAADFSAYCAKVPRWLALQFCLPGPLLLSGYILLAVCLF